MTEIEKLKLQLETMTNDRDAEKSMKATARMQRDEQTQRANDWRKVAHKSEQTIIDLKYQLVNANEIIRRYMESV